MVCLLTQKHKQLPGFAETFGTQLGSSGGWTHLYACSWFYTCTVSSIVYFALGFVEKYAKEEKAMSFESLGGASGVVQELHAVEPESDVSEVNLPVEQKV